jgi:hypothetical protein
MTKKAKNENGFLPLLITLVLALAIVIFVVYLRVHSVQG